MSDGAAIRKLGDEFVEAYNAGDLNRIRDFSADDMVDMSAGGPTQTAGGQETFPLASGGDARKIQPQPGHSHRRDSRRRRLGLSTWQLGCNLGA